MEDDLKKYEVHLDKPPIWYHRTIREFIAFHCPDMHTENKLLLLHLLDKIEPKQKKDNLYKLRKVG